MFFKKKKQKKIIIIIIKTNNFADTAAEAETFALRQGGLRNSCRLLPRATATTWERCQEKWRDDQTEAALPSDDEDEEEEAARG